MSMRSEATEKVIGKQVRIVEDCRDGEDVSGQVGVLEGCFPVEGVLFGDDGPKFMLDNPRIRLEDGSVIWGYQCWWEPVTEDLPPLAEAKEEWKIGKELRLDEIFMRIYLHQIAAGHSVRLRYQRRHLPQVKRGYNG